MRQISVLEKFSKRFERLCKTQHPQVKVKKLFEGGMEGYVVYEYKWDNLHTETLLYNTKQVYEKELNKKKYN